MFRLGVPELLIIGLIVLFLFGGKRLPEMGKGIGEGIRALKSGMKDATEEPTKVAATPVETKAADSSSHPS